MQKIIPVILYLTLSLFILSVPVASTTSTLNRSVALNINNQTFRNHIIHYLRGIASQQEDDLALQQLQAIDALWSNYYQATDWSVTISLYHMGAEVGAGYAHGPHLVETLKRATELSLSHLSTAKLTIDELDTYRFKVVFDYFPSHLYSFIEFKDQGLELIGNRVAVRRLTTPLIRQQIEQSQAYLLRSMHPQWHGFFKFYNAHQNKKEALLRTIYSSSSLYTFLKLYSLTKDEHLTSLFKPIADFILSQQLQTGPNAGGFYYAFNPETQNKSCVLVVGTASKTIFTLLELHHFYPDNPQYLAAAVKAGNWLLNMVHADGQITPIAQCKKGRWTYSHKQSFLYSGQVLSALSRLYSETHDARYHQGAAKIAAQFLRQIDQQGPLVGDDYRPANSISTSWVLMSFIDFAKIDDHPQYLTAIERIADTVLARQIQARDDIYSNGRYLDAMTASGNGWINEVMGNAYTFCQSKQLPHCERYRYAMKLTSRWLLQNAYNEENTYDIKSPAEAIGGFITKFTTQTVRTDAVCHGVNSLIALLAITGNDEQPLLTLPERPLIEILPLLRAGNGFLKRSLKGPSK